MVGLIIIWVIALLVLPASVYLTRRGYRRMDGSPWLFWFMTVLAMLFATLVAIGVVIDAPNWRLGIARAVSVWMIVFAFMLLGALYPLGWWRFLQWSDRKGAERRTTESTPNERIASRSAYEA